MAEPPADKDKDPCVSVKEKLEKWERSRKFVRIFLYVSGIFVITALFYAPAMVYTYTYNNGNPPTPRELVSTRWTFPFVVQCLYPLWWIVTFISASEMLNNWHKPSARAFFRFHAAWVVIFALYEFATGIALVVELLQANTMNSPTNFFNDYRWCFAFHASAPGGTAFCKGTDGYSPALVAGDLHVSPEGMWMIIWHWLYMLPLGMQVVVLIYYLQNQPTSSDIETLSKCGEAPEEQPLLTPAQQQPELAQYRMPTSTKMMARSKYPLAKVW
jgi:hypothetical protein